MTATCCFLRHPHRSTRIHFISFQIRVILSLEWSAGALSKAELQEAFQTWGKKTKPDRLNCTVLQHLEDGRVLVEIAPAPGAVLLFEIINLP